MSLHNRSTRRLTPIAAIALIAISLTACFKPMLAEQGTFANGAANHAQPAIYVEELRTRIGQKLRNQLIYDFSGVNQSDAAPYHLSISLNRSLAGGLVQSTTEALAETVTLNAEYTLTDSATGTVVHGGSSFSRATYDKGAALFANQRALRDAEDRAAIELAQDIRTRIAAYFASKQG